MPTDTIAAGADTDGDGIADAWEQTWFGNLTTANASSDYDHDGMTDLQECLAGTSPTDTNDSLRIAHTERGVPPHSSTHVILEWTAKASVDRIFREYDAAPEQPPRDPRQDLLP